MLAIKLRSYNISIEIIQRCASAYSATAFGATVSRSAAPVFPATSSAARSGAANPSSSSTSTTTASPAARRAASAAPAAWASD